MGGRPRPPLHRFRTATPWRSPREPSQGGFGRCASLVAGKPGRSTGPNVLQGARRPLSDIALLECELSLVALYEGSPLLRGMLAWLEHGWIQAGERGTNRLLSAVRRGTASRRDLQPAGSQPIRPRRSRRAVEVTTASRSRGDTERGFELAVTSGLQDRRKRSVGTRRCHIADLRFPDS
jgi:hypothetical protein